MPDDHPSYPPLRSLRRIAIVEGATLIILVLIAVPLKRLAGIDELVSVMGPVHGAAFMIYLYAVAEAWGAGELTGWLTKRAVLAAQIPFGTWINDRALERHATTFNQTE